MQEFKLSGSIASDHPVQMLDYPAVVIEPNSTATTSTAGVLLTDQGIVYPRYVLFGSTYADWSQISDFKKQTSERDGLLFALVLFLLPSILFWFALSSLLKLFLAFIVLITLGYFLPRMVKHRISFVETIKCAVLAIPGVTIIGVGLSPIAPGPMFWWGFLVSAVVFIIAIALLSERSTKPHKHDGAKYK